jgi:hypothetical protein
MSLPVDYGDRVAAGIAMKAHRSILRLVSQALGLDVPLGDARLAEHNLVRAVWSRMRRCEDPSGSRPAGLAFFKSGSGGTAA